MKTFKWLFLFYLVGINLGAFLFSYISSHSDTTSIFLNETSRSLIFSALGGNIGTLSFLYFIREERVSLIFQIVLWLILLYQIIFVIWIKAILTKKNNS